MELQAAVQLSQQWFAVTGKSKNPVVAKSTRLGVLTCLHYILDSLKRRPQCRVGMKVLERQGQAGKEQKFSTSLSIESMAKVKGMSS